MARDLRFDNVPFGRTQFAPTLWTKSVTVGAQCLRPPRGGGLLITLSRGRAFEMLGTCALIICHLAGLVLLQSDFQSWDIIPTQVPKLTASINVHGAFPKIDRWSSRSQIRERTLQDRLRLPSKRHQLKVFQHWAKKILLRLRYSQVLSKQPIESQNTR
jgi:hypothetical protein